eukprot:228532-Alexandrium_andersonii.AAC.1
MGTFGPEPTIANESNEHSKLAQHLLGPLPRARTTASLDPTLILAEGNGEHVDALTCGWPQRAKTSGPDILFSLHKTVSHCQVLLRANDGNYAAT